MMNCGGSVMKRGQSREITNRGTTAERFEGAPVPEGATGGSGRRQDHAEPAAAAGARLTPPPGAASKVRCAGAEGGAPQAPPPPELQRPCGWRRRMLRLEV